MSTTTNGSVEGFKQEYLRQIEQLGELEATVTHLRNEARRRHIDLPDIDGGDVSRITLLMQTYGIDEPLSSIELDTADFSTTYLIENVMPVGQPSVIAGPAKGMKTTSAIDAALSIANARKFLNHFWVPEAKRVLFLSAESGEATIQETARRIAKAKGLESLSDDQNVHWGFWVPQAKNAEKIEVLEHQLDKFRPDAVFIDPLYQVLDGEDAANYSMNGKAIMDLSKVCLDRDCTPVMIDHVKRSSVNAREFQPLELEDVSGAGKAESFRSWMLIGRREKFDPERPEHRLWLSVGGSAGHHGGYAVDVDESRDDAGNRTWEVSVRFASDARSEAITEAEQAKQEARNARTQAQVESNAETIRQTWRDSQPRTQNDIGTYSGLSPQKTKQAIAYLIRLDELEAGAVVTKSNGQEYDGFRWTRKANHAS